MQGAYTAGSGWRSYRGIDRDQPDASICHFRHRRVIAISNRTRQSETHWESHHGRSGWARMWDGIMGDGGVRYWFQLVTFVLARFALELQGQNPTRRRTGSEAGLWDGAIIARFPQVSASK